MSQRIIHQFLTESGIPGIHGVDTRAITRRLRSDGVMMGMITSNNAPQQALEELHKVPSYGSIDFVKQVTTQAPYQWQPEGSLPKYHIAVLDCGLKYNIFRILNRWDCSVTAVSCTAFAGEILALKPDGILLSPGPGTSELLDYVTPPKFVEQRKQYSRNENVLLII